MKPPDALMAAMSNVFLLDPAVTAVAVVLTDPESGCEEAFVCGRSDGARAVLFKLAIAALPRETMFRG